MLTPLPQSMPSVDASAPTNLEEIYADLLQSSREDQDRAVPFYRPATQSLQTGPVHMPLAQLFDLNTRFWRDRIADSAPAMSLNEELEVWDILDMDAEGEDDSSEGHGRDDFTEDILST